MTDNQPKKKKTKCRQQKTGHKTWTTQKNASIEIKSVDRGCTCNNLDDNCSVQFVNRSHIYNATRSA